MKRDPSLAAGFYWVRFEGDVIVAERVNGHVGRIGRTVKHPHWHVPGTDDCYLDEQICERLSGRLKRSRASSIGAERRDTVGAQESVVVAK